MELRDRIINSAYELFSIKGYEKTTIAEIIQLAECSKGGFYHHFKSKEEILEVIISNYIDNLSKSLKNIVTNNDYTFIEKFNAIFMVISQYKLHQLTEWSKVNNLFIFSGNDRILRQIEKQFIIATTGAYFKVIRLGEEQATVNVKHTEILAELCTRVILWIFEVALKLINSDDDKDHNRFEKLLDFNEELINHELGLQKNQVKFKDTALSYLQNIREYYLGKKEELR